VPIEDHPFEVILHLVPMFVEETPFVVDPIVVEEILLHDPIVVEVIHPVPIVVGEIHPVPIVVGEIHRLDPIVEIEASFLAFLLLHNLETYFEHLVE
jgi:hypothetical protein